MFKPLFGFTEDWPVSWPKAHTLVYIVLKTVWILANQSASNNCALLSVYVRLNFFCEWVASVHMFKPLFEFAEKWPVSWPKAHTFIHDVLKTVMILVNQPACKDCALLSVYVRLSCCVKELPLFACSNLCLILWRSYPSPDPRLTPSSMGSWKMILTNLSTCLLCILGLIFF